MKFVVSFAVIALFVSSVAPAAVKTKVIEYKAGDTMMEGLLAWDDAQGDAAKRPGIVVFPEWWGLTDYPKHRAEQLAQLGYVAFAADMYGKGVTTDDPKQAGEHAGQVKGNAGVERERIEAAIDVLKRQPQVDAEQLGAIGYCFGGTMALDAVRAGQPLKGVVSFHGDLSTKTPAEKVSAKVLALTGADDKWVPADQVKAFEDEMKKAGADVKVVSYPGAQHAFSNPGADKYKLDNVKYNAAADKQSWEAMKQFFTGLFGKAK